MVVSGEGTASSRRWFLWGLGSFLIVAGLFALLYVGALQVSRSGAYSLSLPVTPATPQVRLAPALALTPTPSPPLPLLNREPDPTPPLPVIDPGWYSTLARMIIPQISVDSPIIEVAWHVEYLAGQPVTVWDVAKYAVGHHHSSGNPGEGTNIVLAGHSGGFGAVFRRLLDLQPGDEVILYGVGRQYLYVVEEVVLVQEVNVPMEERLENARYMAPAEEERVTMITCWPVGVYDHRVIVLARPYSADPFPRPDLVAD